MPRFAANLSTMYTEHALLDRFAAASADGFEAVEMQFPYEATPGELAARLRENRLQQVLINAPPGDWARGERGLACLPGREAEFRRSLVEEALPYARALGCPRVHVMAGVAPPDVPPGALQATYRANLAWAVQQAAAAGVLLLVEPIDPRDVPGYFLTHQAQAHAIVEALASPQLAVQMDLYHCQIVEGDLAMKLRRYLPTGRVGHLQIAGVPERQEPDVGEVHHPYLFELVDRLGYAGWIGCEYRPRGLTSEGLGWLHREGAR